MSRSVAIRCLIELGLAGVAYYVVDPKTKIGYEGETPALRKYLRRAKLKWEPKKDPRDWGAPASYKPGRRSRALTKLEVNAAVERANARSKSRQS
jgi:hypothetical protein